MRLFALAAALAAVAALSGTTPAQDKKGTVVELAGMKAATPADWASQPEKVGSMRMNTFKLAKADGDPKDAELAVFFFKGNAGSIDQNLKRQEAKFEAEAGKKLDVKVEKTKVGTHDATYQDIQGSFLEKFPPFDPNAKITRRDNYRQLYVALETNDGQYFMTLLGPTKTIEKHKKAFDEWLKNFK